MKVRKKNIMEIFAVKNQGVALFKNAYEIGFRKSPVSKCSDKTARHCLRTADSQKSLL